MRATALAWRAFLAGFSPVNQYPGQRDFVWLTMFVAVLVAAISVNLSVFGGLNDTLRQTILGATQEHGVGLRVVTPALNTASSFGKAQHDALLQATSSGKPVRADSQLGENHTDISGQALRLFPWREISMSAGRVGLPRSAEGEVEGVTWHARGARTRLSQRRFDGLAISMQDPLWQIALDHADAKDWRAKGALPLVLIISRSTVDHVDFTAYGRILRRALPADDHDDIPKNAEEMLAARKFYILVKQGRETVSRQIMAAEVIWADSIPGPDEVQFLMPLETFTALSNWPAYCPYGSRRNVSHGVYFPEGHGNTASRVRLIQIPKRHWRGIGDAAVRQNVAASLASCMGGAVSNRVVRGVPKLSVTGRLEADVAATCIKQAFPKMRRVADFVSATDSLPFKLNSEWNIASVKSSATENCPQLSERRVAISDQATDGVVYVSNDTAVPHAREQILSFSSSEGARVDYLLDFEPAYRRTLSRFSVLEEILAGTKLPIVALFVSVGVILIFVQLMLALSHRRAIFGLLLIDGEGYWFVRAFFGAQVLFSCGAALILVWIVQLAVVSAFNLMVSLNSDAAQVAVHELGVGIGDLTQLPGVSVTLAVWSFITSICILIPLLTSILRIRIASEQPEAIEFS